MEDHELVEFAKKVIDDTAYMVLGTADATGNAWASPVFFSHREYKDFYWISLPDVTHSQNLAARSQLGIVIFNSKQVPGSGEGVYISAVAEQLTGDDLVRGVEFYPGPRAGMEGVRYITPEEVSPPGPYRLYRATASEHFVLCPRETGQPCTRHGLRGDHRTTVRL
jgi:Pyridoxamine 5'-phosphate oxidase